MEDNATQWLLCQVKSLVSEFNKKRTSEATKQAMSRMRDKRMFLGQVPFGFDLASDGKHLIKNKTEHAIRESILRWRSEGASYREIADRLSASGIRTKTGKARWTHTAVKSIIDRSKLWGCQ